jgi:hypothetical protein
VVHGICEMMNGNWSQLEMTRRLGASAAQASLALAAFWGMVTFGCVLFALSAAGCPRGSPIAACRSCQWVPSPAGASCRRTMRPPGSPSSGWPGWVLRALPLTISFGEEELTAVSAAVAGGVIACYQRGYGIAAFGAAPGTRRPEPAIFGGTAFAAAALAGLSFVVSPPGRAGQVPRARATSRG